LDDVPVVQDLLISIRDKKVIEDYGGFGNLGSLTDSWTKRLGYLKVLSGG